MGYFDGYISAKEVADIYYITRGCLHSDQKTREILKNLLQILKILDTTEMDCKASLDAELADYEDAIMVETAKRNDLDGIVTRNLGDYREADVRVFAPQELLAEIGAELP